MTIFWPNSPEIGAVLYGTGTCAFKKKTAHRVCLMGYQLVGDFHMWFLPQENYFSVVKPSDIISVPPELSLFVRSERFQYKFAKTVAV